METEAKKPVYKKWWFWVIAILVIGAMGSRVSRRSEGHAEETKAASTSSNATSSNEAAPEPKPNIEDQKSHTVSASSLFSQYEANEVSADNKYKDKTFYVTGTVESIGKDILDHPYVSLKTSNMVFTVQCMIEDAAALGKLSKGNTVTVHGMCDGKLGNVLMKDCEIVPSL